MRATALRRIRSWARSRGLYLDPGTRYRGRGEWTVVIVRGSETLRTRTWGMRRLFRPTIESVLYEVARSARVAHALQESESYFLRKVWYGGTEDEGRVAFAEHLRHLHGLRRLLGEDDTLHLMYELAR